MFEPTRDIAGAVDQGVDGLSRIQRQTIVRDYQQLVWSAIRVDCRVVPYADRIDEQPRRARSANVDSII